MNKFLLLAAIFAFSFVLLSGCAAKDEKTGAPTTGVGAGTDAVGSTPFPSPEGQQATSTPVSGDKGKVETKEEFVAKCNALSQDDKLKCLEKAAVLYEDYNLCSQQTSESERSLCQAAVSGSSLKCNGIKNESMKAICYNVVGVNTGNAEVCNKISANQTYYRKDCLFNVAFRQGNSALCSEYFSTPDAVLLKQQCTALASKNPVKCESIESENFGPLAKKYKDRTKEG